MVEKRSGGRHAAGEDRGGDLGCGPEGGRLEGEGLVWAAGAEGDDEAHYGGYAGAVAVSLRRGGEVVGEEGRGRGMVR